MVLLLFLGPYSGQRLWPMSCTKVLEQHLPLSRMSYREKISFYLLDRCFLLLYLLASARGIHFFLRSRRRTKESAY
jgi:hypothetical protein